MAFQFQCPQGHLLEGDESQAGQQCVCPVCQMLFLIPAPLPGPATEPLAGGPGPEGSGPAGNEGGQGISATSESDGRPVFDAKRAQEPELLHIPCPQGHELEVPRDMLDQDVLCPHCNSQFRLRERNSVEYKRRQEEEQLRRDIRSGNLWLKWAIVLAGLVIFGLILLIASRS